MRFKRMLERRATVREAGTDTRARLLDAAERLFADDGIAQSSLRAITLAAGVNVAAIHYHFGSKEALLEAVFTRRLAPVNEERLSRLGALEGLESNGNGNGNGARAASPTLEGVLEAFLAPVLRLLRDPDGGRLGVLFGRLYTEPEEIVVKLLRDQFGEVSERFTAALMRALPELPEPEIRWRLHCAVGAMGHLLASARFPEIAREFGVPDDGEDATLRRLIGFCAAGFRAPVVPATETKP